MSVPGSRASLERLCKWRAFLADWQLGTREDDDPEWRAVRDHREATMLLRAELHATVGLLIEKGVFTAEEHAQALYDAAELLSADYSQRFPGITATDDGLTFDVAEMHEQRETLKKGLFG